MLQNEPSLAIVAVHTEENGPSKVRQVTNRIRRNIGPKHRLLPNPELLRGRRRGRRGRREHHLPQAAAPLRHLLHGHG